MYSYHSQATTSPVSHQWKFYHNETENLL